jgi:hypothetical protein
MSAKNGDKSRFGRLRKQRILQRTQIEKLRDDMGSVKPKTATVQSAKKA